MTSQSVLLLVAFAMVAASGVARAQDQPAEPAEATESAETSDDADDAAEREATASAIASRGYMELTAGRYSKAVELLELADRLAYSPVILVALAEAYEKLGRLVKADKLLKELAKRGPGANASATFRAAHEKAQKRWTALKKRIPKVRIIAGGPGVEVQLDGRVLSDAELRQAVAVNPGPHFVVAGERECNAQQRTFDIAEGGHRTLRFKTASSTAETQPVTETRPPSVGVPRWHLGATLMFAVSGASMAAAIGTGVAAIAQRDDFDERCPNNACPPDVMEEVRDAEMLGTVALVSFGAGLVTAGAGALMWWAGSGDASEPHVAVVPGAGSISLVGRF